MKRNVFILFMLLLAIISKTNAQSHTIEVKTAGTLSQLLNANATSATISGNINGTDINYLRSCISNNTLKEIDLSDVRIVSGGSSYDGTNYTQADVIGVKMFYDLDNLKKIVLPRALSKIDKQAFSNCDGLTEITIPHLVTNIGFDAFAYCRNLANVSIGASVTNIEQGAFYESGVQTATVYTNKAPSISLYLFSSNPSIIVPNANYRNTSWSNFGPITTIANLSEKVMYTFFSDYMCTNIYPIYKGLANERFSKLEGGIGQDLYNIIIKIKTENWAKYEKQQRIHEYRPYANAKAWHTKAKTTGFSYMGNPTGIYAAKTQDIYVFVDDNIPSDAQLYIQGCLRDDLIDSSSKGKKLNRGMNVVTANASELQYIVYTVNTTSLQKKVNEWPNIKIHIEGGIVNGVYDCSHHNDTEYQELLAAATHTHFTVKGENSVFNLKTESYRQIWPTSIESSVAHYDELIRNELALMGISTKVANGEMNCEPFMLNGGDSFYPDYVNNPFFAIQGTADDAGYANSSPYRVIYNSLDCITKSLNIFDPDYSNWCAAHENGHNNQQALYFRCLTESSNNLFSNFICFTDGKERTQGSAPMTAYDDFINGVSFYERDIWSTTRMFYQLYLYYHQLGHNTSFYPTLFKALREDPLSQYGNINNCSLKLVRKICEVAQEDLTDFFKVWGFFVPFNGQVDDYIKCNYYTNDGDIEATLAEISQYPKKNIAPLFIEDRIKTMNQSSRYDASQPRLIKDGMTYFGDKGNITDFITETGTPNYVHVQTDNHIKMIGNGGIGFVVRNDVGEILCVSNQTKFDIPQDVLKKDFNIYVVDRNGKEYIAPFLKSGIADVTVKTAGTLSDNLPDSFNYLRVAGPLNGKDIKCILKLINDGVISDIDMRNARIVAGGGTFADPYTSPEPGNVHMPCVTEDDAISGGMFFKNEKLQSIILPTSIKKIDREAFYMCNNLHSIIIPDNVTYLGPVCFGYCKALKEVTIGSSVNDVRTPFCGSPVANAYAKPRVAPVINAGYTFWASKPTIHVYRGSGASYKQKVGIDAWSSFGPIVEDLDDYCPTIPEIVNGHSVTVSTVQYTSFYDSKNAVILPKDTKAYAITFENGDMVMTEAYNGNKANNIIPANEPVVINAPSGTYSLKFTSSNARTLKSQGRNILDGTDVETALENDSKYYYYALSINKESNRTSAGFYWMNSTGSAFTNGAHKAYIKLAKNTPTNNAKESGFPFEIDDITAINNPVTNNNSHGISFNIMGQRVNKNAKGIVITNGKKYINK